ncbi:hypothetical protein ACVQ92_03975 [Staphylococcus aureus]
MHNQYTTFSDFLKINNYDILSPLSPYQSEEYYNNELVQYRQIPSHTGLQFGVENQLGGFANKNQNFKTYLKILANIIHI